MLSRQQNIKTIICMQSVKLIISLPSTFLYFSLIFFFFSLGDRENEDSGCIRSKAVLRW